MEHVVEVYEMPHDPEVPVVVMDEQPVQLFKEVRASIPATKNHARRVDYEYERTGVASVFMFTSPLERRYRFKERLYSVWREHAELYAERLERHTGKHMRLLYEC